MVDDTRTPAVPVVGVLFWVIKALSTAMGESSSDLLVHAVSPVAAVLLGCAGFLLALLVQFRRGRYVPWAFWLSVVMVGTFGTMAADVLHAGFGVPYNRLQPALRAGSRRHLRQLGSDRADPVNPQRRSASA